MIARLAAGTVWCMLAPLGAQAGSINALFDQDNLPYSSRTASLPGLYVDIAQLIAVSMGAELIPHWADTEDTGVLSPLLEEDATIDVVVGVPVEPRTVEDEQRVGNRVAYSKPFASAGYRVVTARGHSALPDLKAMGLSKVGVETGSVAGLRLWDDGFVVDARPTQAAILDGLLKGALEFGVAWGNVEWIIGNDPRYRDRLAVQAVMPDFEGMRWNLAVAVRKDDAAQLKRVNEAVDALLASGVLKQVFARYNMTCLDPVDLEDRTE
ncbi:MAG: transporter substrate-binding domain-containing protein [Candidatus Hydrogenedentes bacterium]|nr:transporter substrate-binding domain-containing protein [Candidatus Hydrogenedentota bacterium]